MRGQFLLFFSFLLTPWYNPNDYYQHQVMEFSPERAARLHNQLLQKAISHDPSITTERTLLGRFLQVADVGSEFQRRPLGQFLSLLDSTPQRESRAPGLFSPRLHQPDPSYFWDGAFELHPDHVLLYGQNNDDSAMDGGIYINLDTARVIWRQRHSLSLNLNSPSRLKSFIRYCCGTGKAANTILTQRLKQFPYAGGKMRI